MAGLVQFAGWLATQVFDVVGQVAGAQGGSGDDVAGDVDLQVGKTVFHGVPPKMRAELWMSQLQRRSTRTSSLMGEYRDLLFETLSPDVLSEIDKDTHRTFPGHPWLSSPEGQAAMLNVLRAYALSDPEIGYTQGMNFLAGLLLTYLPSEAEAFCALSLLMRARGLRGMYLPDMRLLQIRLWQLGKLLPPRLAAHLETHAVLPVLYASSWLLTCFAADFPWHFSARVMDVLLTGHEVASPVLKIAVGILARCEADLLRMDDFEEMVGYLRQEVPRWPRQALQDLLTDALSKPWSARQLAVLDEINGAETVMEAVARVNNLAQTPTADAAEVAALAAEARAASGAAPAGGGAAPSPRTVARSLSASFRARPLPPPPSGRADVVPWDAWQAADLQLVATQAVRIERSIGDLVDLDPQLSQALSAYPHADAASGPSFTGWGTGGGGHAQRLQGLQEEPEQPAASPARAAGGATAASPAGTPDAAAQQRWDEFASQTSKHLQAAPSPFGGPSPPIRAAATVDTAQLQALQRVAGAEDARGAARSAPVAELQTAPAADGDVSEAVGSTASYGSFQLGNLHSEAPLVDIGSAAASGGSADSARRAGFLGGLFGGRGSPPRGQPSAGSAAGSDLLREVPSSHGSSLAAVLSQLGLGSGGGGPSSEPGAGPGPPRELRRGGAEDDEFGSFKTASQGSARSAGALSLGTHSSWRSVEGDRPGSSAPSSTRLTQAGGPARLPSGLSSTASSTLPAAAAAASPPTPPERVASMQEQHLAGFLASGKAQAQRAADNAALGLGGGGGRRA